MSITPRVIQRTPDLGIKIKLQRLPVVPDAVPAAAPPKPVEVLPPFWEGRDDEDGVRQSTLSIGTSVKFTGEAVYTYFDEALFVAVVDGAAQVDWSISLEPGRAHGAVQGYGTAFVTELSSVLREGPQAPRCVVLEAVEGEDSCDKRRIILNKYELDLPLDDDDHPLIYYPTFAAVGNTLVVGLHDVRATIPCKVEATASVAGAEVGTVVLRLDYYK